MHALGAGSKFRCQGSKAARLQALPDAILAAAEAPAPSARLSADQTARLRALAAALSTAEAPAPAQRLFAEGAAAANKTLDSLANAPGPAPSGELSVRQQETLNAVIEAYKRGAQAPGPAASLSTEQKMAARSAFAGGPKAAAEGVKSSSGPASGAIEAYMKGVGAPTPSEMLSTEQQKAARSAFAGNPAAAEGSSKPTSSSASNGAIEAYMKGMEAPAPSQKISTEQEKAARSVFANAPAVIEAALNWTTSPADQYSNSSAAPAHAPDPQNLTPAQQDAIRRIFSAPAPAPSSNASTLAAAVETSGVPAHAPDPSQSLTPAQQEDVHRIFFNSSAPAPAPSANNASTGAAAIEATAAPAHAPQQAQTLTSSQQEEIRRLFAPAPAPSSNPSTNGTAEGESISWARAPAPAQNLTREEQDEVRRIFFNSSAPAPSSSPTSELSDIPDSRATHWIGSHSAYASRTNLQDLQRTHQANHAHHKIAATLAGARQHALAPGMAASTEAEDVAAAGEAAPAAWPQMLTAPKSGMFSTQLLLVVGSIKSWLPGSMDC